jgi:hypothetical protein
VALNSIETYRLLIENLQAEGLKLPKEVSLLDYAGFKLQILAAAAQPDWDTMQKTVADAVTWWDTTKPKISEKGLLDTVNSTIKGLQQAAKSKNLEMLHFAAQIDLDVVDLLEGYFEKK